MSEANIMVRIRENSKEAVAKIKKNFQKVDKARLRPDLDIDDSDLKSTEARLKKMDERIEPSVHPTVNKAALASAKVQLKSLKEPTVVEQGKSYKGMDGSHKKFRGPRELTRGAISGNSKNRFPLNKARDLPIGGSGEKLGVSAKDVRPDLSGSARVQGRDSKGRFTGKPRGGLEMARNVGDGSNVKGGLYNAAGDDMNIGLDGSGGELVEKTKKKFEGLTDKFKNGKGELKGFNWKFDQLSEHTRKFGNNIRKYTPNIMMWWKLVAILLPMMIALYVQAMGVAVAMYAIAGAGAAMVGGGLVGMGENMAEGFGHAERKLNRLKRELFQTFKPALEIFEPISTEFLEKLPQRLKPLVDRLTGITVFEGSFVSLFENLVGWLGTAIDKITEHAAVLDQIAHRFGSILGKEVLSFLDFVIDFAYEEQETMVELIDVFKSVLSTVLSLLVAVTYFLAILKPLAQALAYIADLLSNKWGAVIATAIVTLYVFVAVINTAAATIASLHVMLAAGGSWGVFAGFIMKAGGLITTFGTKISILIGKLTVMHALLGGLGLIAAGIGGSYAMKRLSDDADNLSESRSRTGTGGQHNHTHNTNIHVEGKDAESASRKLEDRFPDLYEQEVGRRNSRNMG